MEHRYSKRLAVGFKVTLGYRKRWFPVATARDLSPEGMFVLTDGITLPTGTLVELAFQRHGRDWLIAAVVAHVTTEGVGVMFRETEPSLYASELHARHAGQSLVGSRVRNGLRIGA